MKTVEYLYLKSKLMDAKAKKAEAEATIAHVEYDVYDRYGKTIQELMDDKGE